jgi:hypothetical protein
MECKFIFSLIQKDSPEEGMFPNLVRKMFDRVLEIGETDDSVEFMIKIACFEVDDEGEKINDVMSRKFLKNLKLFSQLNQSQST